METENNTALKWCVEVTDENREIVGKWFNKNNTTGYNGYHEDIDDNIHKYLGFPERSSSHYFSKREVEENGYIILSFEGFKRDILKISDIPEKWMIRKVDDDLIEPLKALFREVEYHYVDDLHLYTNGDYCIHYPLINTESIWQSLKEIDYKEIDSNTLRKILKMEKNSKQILGYKIKEDCRQYISAIEAIVGEDRWSDCEECFINMGYHFPVHAPCYYESSFEGKLEKAKLLSIWFEPVYSNEYKVGDWVVVKSWKQGGSGNGINEDNLVSQLYELNKHYGKEDGGGVLKGDFRVKYKGKYYSIHSSHIIRKATEEEIEASKLTVITIGTSNIKVTISKGKIIAEKQEVNIEELASLYLKMSNFHVNLPWNVSLETVKLGCSNFSVKEIESVLITYDEINKTTYSVPF